MRHPERDDRLETGEVSEAAGSKRPAGGGSQPAEAAQASWPVLARGLLGVGQDDSMANDSRPKERKPKGLVLLKDLMPRKDPKGGSAGKAVFGQQPVAPQVTSRAPAARPGAKKKK